MRRDYLISTDFHSISRGQVNQRHRIVIAVLIGLIVVLGTVSAIGFFADKDSDLHFYALNAFHGYGYSGKLWNGIYMCGIIAVVMHGIVFFVCEGRGHLSVITDLKKMFRRLDNPSAEEAATFLYFLKVMSYIREVAFITIWLPMILFRAVGAVLTAIRFKSLGFIVSMCVAFIPFMIVQQYICYIHGYAHLLIAQSTTYFKLRLNRVTTNFAFLISSLDFKSNPSDSQKTSLRIETSVMINKQLLDLSKILNEVGRHNRCIKHWLRNELFITGCLWAFCFFESMGDIEWYYKVSTVVSIFSWTACLCPSFLNAAKLYIHIQSIAKVLHSCQTRLQNQAQSQSRKSEDKSLEVIQQLDPINITKTKYQIMRMIHRVSSRYLRIGFTEGNGESFCPSSIIKFLSTVAFNSLMFLNARTSTMKAFLDI